MNRAHRRIPYIVINLKREPLLVAQGVLSGAAFAQAAGTITYEQVVQGTLGGPTDAILQDGRPADRSLSPHHTSAQSGIHDPRDFAPDPDRLDRDVFGSDRRTIRIPASSKHIRRRATGAIRGALCRKWAHI